MFNVICCVKPSGFTGPPVVSGLAVWLDASQLALADGASVTTWPNLGSGSTPTIVAGSSPMIFKTNMLNGKPVVRFAFDGSRVRGNHGLSLDYTILYVVRRWGTNIGRAFGSTYPPPNFLVGFHGSNQDIMYDNGWFNAGAGWGSYPGDWKLYGADGASAGSYQARFFINGTLSGGPQGGAGMQNTYNLSGYDVTGNQETMDCDVAELLIYDHRLLDADRIQVEGYLRTKWFGLSSTNRSQLFDPGDTPVNVSGATAAILTGTAFFVTASCNLIAIRFYKDSTDPNTTHTVNLWDTGSHAKLAEQTSSSEPVSGWVEVAVTPVSLTTNKAYYVTTLFPSGYYSYTIGYFGSASMVRGPITGYQDGTVPGGATANNGIYTFNSSPAYPDSGYNANYWSDPVVDI